MWLSPDRAARGLQGLRGWTAVNFQIVALSYEPRAFVLKCCSGFADGGRGVFKMWLSPYPDTFV
eukprot:4931684-Pyramimonas_sp.AAC.1